MQNLPTTLYRTAQVRELDRVAIHEQGIPGFELMSRAGYEVFQWIRNKWPDTKSVAVFCGGGNNAGDGYIVARLALEAGLKICAYSLSEPTSFKGDALTAYQGYIEAKGTVIPFQGVEIIDAEVIVDALLGTGLDRPVAGLYALACQVHPDVTPAEFWQEALRTGRTIQLNHDGEPMEFGTIADPVRLIEALRSRNGPAVVNTNSRN